MTLENSMPSGRVTPSFIALPLIVLPVVCGLIILLSIYKRDQFAALTPETATILSKREYRHKSNTFTEVSIAYVRQTKDGSQQCATSVKLPEWSTRYDPGNAIAIWPRQDSCHEPWATPPEYTASLWTNLVPLAAMFLIGARLIYRDREDFKRWMARGGQDC